MPKPKEDEMALRYLALRRVERSPQMRPLRSIIFTYWPNWEEHLQWVIKARVAEIVSWAKQIQRDCEGCGNE